MITGKFYLVRIERYSGLGTDKDGKLVASLSADRMTIDLVDPGSPKVLKSIESGPIFTFATSPDGSTIATVDEKNLVTTFSSSGSQISAFQAANKDPIKAVEISPDGKMVATLSGGNLGELYIWDTASGKKLSTLSG